MSSWLLSRKNMKTREGTASAQLIISVMSKSGARIFARVTSLIQYYLGNLVLLERQFGLNQNNALQARVDCPTNSHRPDTLISRIKIKHMTAQSRLQRIDNMKMWGNGCMGFASSGVFCGYSLCSRLYPLLSHITMKRSHLYDTEGCASFHECDDVP